MADFPQRADWATPLVARFDPASLASRLRLTGTPSCRAREQGRCEGRYLCADCAWSEESSPGR